MFEINLESTKKNVHYSEHVNKKSSPDHLGAATSKYPLAFCFHQIVDSSYSKNVRWVSCHWLKPKGQSLSKENGNASAIRCERWLIDLWNPVSSESSMQCSFNVCFLQKKHVYQILMILGAKTPYLA